MRIYVAGLMTGILDDNLPAFFAARDRLAARGHEPVIPCDVSVPQGALSWAEWMRRDIALLLTCEAVALLPGWERSRGACREVTVALTVGMPLFTETDMQPVPIDAACARMECRVVGTCASCGAPAGVITPSPWALIREG